MDVIVVYKYWTEKGDDGLGNAMFTLPKITRDTYFLIRETIQKSLEDEGLKNVNIVILNIIKLDS